jgi:hypothetical protein
MVGEKRIQEIRDIVDEHGIDRAVQITGLSSESINRYLRTNTDSEPEKLSKILLLDIETAPMVVYVWQMWKNDIAQNQVISDWFIISWSVKWLYEPDVYSDVLTPQEAVAHDDERIVRGLWEYIDSAQLVVAHNGRKFDLPKANTRFLHYGMMPPSPYVMIDTLDTLKRFLKVSSNRLNYVNEFLGIDTKIDTGGFELWSGCMNGDAESLSKMDMYNRNDVLILEELYVKLRPWIKPHPNMALYDSETDSCCPSCCSKRLEYVGYYTTYANKYKSWRCLDCGAISRSRKSSTPPSERANLLLSVPK